MLKHKTVRRIAYALFGLAALAACLYWTFPAQAVGQRLAYEIHRRSQGHWTASFDDVSPYRLTGLMARGVHLKHNIGDTNPEEFYADAVKARLRILPLFLLRVSFKVQVDLGKGSLYAKVRNASDRFELAVELEDLDLASPPNLPKWLGLPLGGKLDGEIDATVAKDPKATTGTIALSLTNGQFGPGTVSGFTLPRVSLGRVNLKLDMAAGRFQVASFEQQGGDIKMRLTGSGQARMDLGTSSLDLCAAARVEPAFLEQNANLKAALQLAEVRISRDVDGFLHLPFGGPLTAINLKSGLCRQAGSQ